MITIIENVLFWSISGFYSFYFTSRVFGLRNNHVKYMATIGFILGVTRGITGKSLFEIIL
jgi:hypothetical protein